MDENNRDDNQATTTSQQTPSVTGQVMDVTAPARQIDIKDYTSDQAPKVNDEPVADVSPVSKEAPEDSVREPDTEQISDETVKEESAVPAERPGDVWSPAGTSATDIGVDRANSDGSDLNGSENKHNPELPIDAKGPVSHPDQPKTHAKHVSPIMSVIFAIIVAIVLSGLVIFAYTKTKDNGDVKRSDSAATTTTQTVAEKPQASVSDVDTTSKEIDSSLQKVDDTKDLSAADFSDTSLGL